MGCPYQSRHGSHDMRSIAYATRAGYTAHGCAVYGIGDVAWMDVYRACSDIRCASDDMDPCRGRPRVTVCASARRHSCAPSTTTTTSSRRVSMRVSAHMARYVPSEDMGDMRVRVKDAREGRACANETVGDVKRRLNWMARARDVARCVRAVRGRGLTNVCE